MMAIDFEGIKRDYYGGEAIIIAWPIVPIKEFKDAYLRLDDPDCPESVKELYSYNPEKAKALLAEAGYPQGFKTNLLTYSTPTTYIDYWSIIKDMWRKVGVDLELRPKESASLVTLNTNRDFDQMITPTTSPTLNKVFQIENLQGTSVRNPSRIDDPVVNEAYAKMQEVLAIPGAAATAEACKIYHELMKHVLLQAWSIPSVAANSYTLWWPWVKNYSGELAIGWTTVPTSYKFVWIDQDLKKSMGYK